MDSKTLENMISELRKIDSNIDHLSSVKKSIDLEMSECKAKKENIRIAIEDYMKSESKNFVSISDGTEISIRNSPKTFSWSDDMQMVDFLKSIGKFDSICSIETVINKKKLKSLLDQLSDCDGMPSFVECVQEKVLQVRSASIDKETPKEKTKSSPGVKSSNIEEFDESQLDGL